MTYQTEPNEKILHKNWPDHLASITEIEDMEHVEYNTYFTCQYKDGQYTFFQVETTNSGGTRKPFYTTPSKQEAAHIIEKSNEYMKAYNEFNQIEIQKEIPFKQGYIHLDKHKHMCYQACVTIDDNIIAHKNGMFSPFESFLLTDKITINGTLAIYGDEHKKQGFAREMFRILDDNTPYEMIPHGYALCPGNLSADGEAFWKKREKHIETPKIVNSFNHTLLAYNEILTKNTLMQDGLMASIEHLITGKQIYKMNMDKYTCFPEYYKSQPLQPVTITEALTGQFGHQNVFHEDAEGLMKHYENYFTTLELLHDCNNMTQVRDRICDIINTNVDFQVEQKSSLMKDSELSFLF